MKRSMVSLLLAVCMAVFSVIGVSAEELELFISNGEMVLDKNDQPGNGSTLDSVNQSNAVILGQLGKKDWTALAGAVEKTGDWREDIIAVAQTQVGYTAPEDGMALYTLWAEYEKPQPWTALFISWVTEQAGLREQDFPRLHTYEEFIDRMGKIHARKNITRTAYPMPGDLALIEKDDQQLIGVVVYVSNGVASVILGDDNGAVTMDLYSVGKNGFKQYIDLNELLQRAGIEVGKGGEVPVIPEGGTAGWTTATGVYMRAEPTTAAKRVVTVRKAGTALIVVSAALQKDGYIWYGVEYGQYEGYIRGDLLTLDASVYPAVTPVPTAKPQPEVSECALCTSVADGVALPNGCCYAQLAALGAEHAPQFMQALREADALTYRLYVNSHDAHVAAGAQAVLSSLGLTERAVNIEVKKAQTGEEITISFDVFGAVKHRWYQVQTVEDIIDGEVVTSEVITLLAEETAPVLTIAAKPGEPIGYFCVATIALQNIEVEMTGKRTMISADAAPIAAEAILGEAVSFTYADDAAAGYRWYRVDPLTLEAAEVPAEEGKLTIDASVEDAGAQYYCQALDQEGRVLSTSSRFVYTVNLEDLCRYVDELVSLSPADRYDLMTGVWAEAGLSQQVAAHWQTGCDGMHCAAYPQLLCTCAELVKHPSDATHAADCAWYHAIKRSDSTGSLTITKTGLRAGESAIFTVTITPAEGGAAQTYCLVLTGPDGAATIAGLPAGAAYTVAEQAGWAWSYAVDDAQTATGTIPAGGSVTETFSGAKVNQWLHDEQIAISNLNQTAGTASEGGEQ